VTLLTVGLVSVIVSLQLLAYGTLNTVVFSNSNNNKVMMMMMMMIVLVLKV